MATTKRDRWFMPLILLMLAVGGCLLASQHGYGEEPAPEAPQEIVGKVVKVYDGDTITVKDSKGQIYKVRLAEIDAPELAQSHGKESRDFVANLVLGRTVRVTKRGRDIYNRWVGTCWFDRSDAWVNAIPEIVYYGHAWHYKAYSHDESLAGLEKLARKAKRGLWADEKAIAPWEYRRRKRAERRKGSRVAPVRSVKVGSDSPAPWLGPHFLAATCRALN